MKLEKETLHGILITCAITQTIVFGFISMVLSYQLSTAFDEVNRIEQLARKAFNKVDQHLSLMHSQEGKTHAYIPLGAPR